jgi:hypothetical protein
VAISADAAPAVFSTAMDLAGRIVATALLALAAGGGAVVPWAACARDAPQPAVRAAAVVVYHLGHLVCSQQADRSFTACARPWPVCGRCAGLYLGAAAGALALAVGSRRRRRPAAADQSRHWRFVLAAAAAPTAFLWLLEHAAGVDPGSLVRCAGAIPFGMAAAAWLAAIGRGDLR